MITIIDYGSGNIRAIANIYEKLNISYLIAKNPDDVIGAKKIFLPGVGAFDETISKLDEIGFRSVLDKEVLENKVPILGICVGMQILAETSEEGSLKGLGYIKGHVKKLDASKLDAKPKLPHLGWNSIEIKRKSPLFDNIDPQKGFYFLHTYYFECSNNNDILSTTHYGNSFSSAINHNNIFGFQFHPEKSHSNGINLLLNFGKL
jgi:glutamine amidotransferase